MGKASTWIKLDRNIINWRWFKDARTLQMFIYLIVRANTTDHDFENITVHRGQLVTSYAHLARSLGISVQSARTAIKHLKLTGEITIKAYPKYSLITVLNYGYYQKSQQGKQQSSNKQPTSNQQQYNNEEELKRILPSASPEVYRDVYEEDWE